MKITKLILIFAVLPIALAGQIPNNSFENWTTISSSNPDIWMSSNTFWFGSNTVMQDSDSYSGQYAALLQTVPFGSDTAKGMLLIGSPGNQTVNGGVPYSGHPDSMICAVRYNIQPADTAVMYIFFKKNGAMAGMFPLRFYGVQSSWLPVKAPVSWFIPDSVNADTVAALISSSNMDYPAIPGSYLAVDGIAYNNDTTPFPNGDFESWITASWDDLSDGWNSLNPLSIPFGQLSATQDTNSYSGSYAVRVQSLAFPTMGNQVLGFIFLGQWTSDGPGGGIPFTDIPTKLTGYYKYFPVPGDTASVTVKFNNDSTLQFSTFLTEDSSYTYFEIPISLVSAPDTVLIGLTANMMGAPVSPGSVLIIDDLNFVILVGDKELQYPLFPETVVFPNPSNGIFSVRRELTQDEYVAFKLIDDCGKEIKNINYGFQIKGLHSFDVNMAGLAPGIYYITSGDSRKLLGKVMFLNSLK